MAIIQNEFLAFKPHANIHWHYIFTELIIFIISGKPWLYKEWLPRENNSSNNRRIKRRKWPGGENEILRLSRNENVKIDTG